MIIFQNIKKIIPRQLECRGHSAHLRAVPSASCALRSAGRLGPGSCAGLTCFMLITFPPPCEYVLLTCYLSLRACVLCVVGDHRQRKQPWGLLPGKEANIEQVLVNDECFRRKSAGHRQRRKSPLKSRDPSFLLKGEQELARQRKWCLLDKGTECAKVKRREAMVRLTTSKNPHIAAA